MAEKTRSTFKHDYLYYPIFTIVPHLFFKTNKIDKKIYDQSENIMIIIKKIIDNTLDKSDENNILEKINLHVIMKFAQSNINYDVISFYVSSSDICYLVDMQVKNKIISIPVNYSDYQYYKNKQPEINIINKPFMRNKVAQTYKDIKEFIYDYNNYVVKMSENANMIKIIPDDNPALSKKERSISPIYPFIKIKKFLVYDNKIIGFTSGVLNYYFKEIAANNQNDLKLFISYMASGSNTYNAFNKLLPKDPVKLIHRLYYDPDNINKLIHKYKENGSKEAMHNEAIYSKAMYSKFAYHIFIMAFYDHIDKERNSQMRSKIKNIVSSMNINNKSSIATTNDKLKNILDDQYIVISDIINSYQDVKSPNKMIQSDIDNLIFGFDRSSLNKLTDMSDSYLVKTQKERESVMINIQKFIHDIAKHFVFMSQKPVESFDEQNLICNMSDKISKHCQKGKIIISKEKLNSIVEAFAADIVNPIKRDFLLSSIYINYMQNNYNFTKQPGEQLYIKI